MKKNRCLIAAAFAFGVGTKHLIGLLGVEGTIDLVLTVLFVFAFVATAHFVFVFVAGALFGKID
jgi:hypothetical protein